MTKKALLTTILAGSLALSSSVYAGQTGGTALDVDALIASNACPAAKAEYPPNIPAALDTATLDRLTRLAGQGRADAMVVLGLRYAAPEANTPEQPTRDFAKAFSLFQRAAKKGQAFGEYLMGVAYMSGQGVKKDEPAALAAFRRAADKGVPPAMYWTGELILKGRAGATKDVKVAVPYLHNAAGAGSDEAYFELGNSYQKGVFGKPDYEKAAYCFRQGVVLKSPLSEFNLRVLIDQHQVAWQPGDPGQPLNPEEKSGK